MAKRASPAEGGFDDVLAADLREARLETLAHAASSGDPRAVEQLVTQFAPLVRSAARRAHRRALGLGVGAVLDRDDLEQEARLALVDLAATYRPGAGPAAHYFIRWLPARLRRRVSRLLAHSIPAAVYFGSIAGDAAAADVSERLFVDAQVEAADDPSEGLRAAFQHLSLRDRRILYLRFWGPHTYAEIGHTMGISPAVAHRATGRALRHLRGAMAGVRAEDSRYAAPPSTSLPTSGRSAVGTATVPSGCW